MHPASPQPAPARPRPPRFGRLYYGWVLVVMLGITQTISWGIVYYHFTVLMPPLEAELGWTRGQQSGAFSLAILLSGLCAAPVGHWIDRHGARLLMTAGSVAASLLMVALAQATTLVQFYVAWALLGMTMSAILYEPAFAVVTMWFEKQRTRALTAVTLMAGLASTIFMPVVSTLTEAYGWRTALTILAAFLAATTILPHALLLRRRPEDHGLSPDGDRPAPTAAHASPRARPAPVPVGVAIREPAFRWLAVAFSLSTVVNIAVGVHLVAYLQDHDFDLTLAATATGAIGALQVTGRIVLGLIGERLSARVLAAVVLGLQPVALAILLTVSGVAGLVLFIVTFGMAKGAMTLIRPAYVVSLYGRERYATIAGALAAFVLAATALAPIGAGAAHDLLRSYDPLFWVFVLLSALAAGVVLLVRRPAA